MRIDPHAFTREYLRGFEARLAAAQPAPESEAADVVVASREKIEKLTRELDPAAPLPALAAAARQAVLVGLKAAVPGCAGLGALSLALAEDALLSLTPPEAPKDAPLPERLVQNYPKELVAFVAAREVAHQENRDAVRREGRQTLLDLLRQTPGDERQERDRLLLQKAASAADARAEEAADVRAAQILHEAGTRREVAAAHLDLYHAEFRPGVPPADRRRQAADQASRLLGFTPVGLPGTRQEVGDRIGALSRRMRERQVGEGELDSAAAALRDLVASSDDPVLRRVAWTALAPLAEWSRLEGLALVHGKAEGARRLLDTIEDRMRGYNAGASTDYPVADALAMVEPSGARTLAHFVNTVAARGAWLAGKEGAAPMEEWASAASAVLDRWWAEGAVQVTRSGQPVAPGALDLRQALAQERAVVRGTEIRLGEDPGDRHTADGLARLAKADPRPDLANLTQEALERGTLALQYGQSKSHVEVLDRVAQAHPEVVTVDFLRSQVGPLLDSQHYDLPGLAAAWLGRLLDARPDLVGPAMDLVTGGHPGLPMVPEKLALLEKAWTQHGWRPSVDWLASRAYQPPTLHADSLFVGSGYHRPEFAFMVDRLADLGAADVEIPRPDGTMTDVKTAVLERVLSDDCDVSPEKLFAKLQEGRDPVVAALYRLVPPSSVVDSLLARVADGLTRAQFLMDLRGPETAALGVLAHASASDPTVIRRLQPLLDGVEGAMGKEVGDFLHGVQSLNVLEKGLRELDAEVSTGLARRLQAWADRSLTGDLKAEQGRRVLDGWATAFRRDVAWGPSLLDALPDRARALDTVEYLETRRPEDPGHAWSVYQPMLAQAGDDETARRMFEAFGDMQAAAVQLGGIEDGEASVRIGGIELPIQRS